MILNKFLLKDDMKEATSRPRIHINFEQNKLRLEGSPGNEFPPMVLQKLLSRGHSVVVPDYYPNTYVHSVFVDQDGSLVATSDPRKQGSKPQGF